MAQQKCSEVLANYKRDIDKLLALMDPNLSQTDRGGSAIYNKCVTGVEYDKINTFDDVKAYTPNTPYLASDLYLVGQYLDGRAALPGDHKCDPIPQDKVTELIAGYLGELATRHHSDRAALPDCTEPPTEEAAARSAAEVALAETKKKCDEFTTPAEMAKLDPSHRLTAKKKNTAENEQACNDLRAATEAVTDAREKQAEAVKEYFEVRHDLLFKEQCFLLGEIYSIAQMKKELDEMSSSQLVSSDVQGLYRTELKRLPYHGISKDKNASIVVDGDPFAFINKLTQNIETRSAFFDMTEAQISNLQPMIRLFKIIEKPGGAGIEEEVEMEFDSNMTNNNMDYFLKSRLLRGTGVGIKDFTLSYEADNPFAITKSIKAKLKLHAATFDELLRTRENSEGTKYSYIDLALKTGGSLTKLRALGEDEPTTDKEKTDLKEEIENLSKLLFRLKVVIGWASPKGDFGGGIITGDLKEAIDQSCITLNLTPTIHEYNFDDAGRVDFTINYLAYVEDFFDQPRFNIFSDAGAASTGQYMRSLRTKERNKKCGTATEEEKKKEIATFTHHRQVGLRNLLDRILSSEKVCYMNMTLEQMSRYKRAGPVGMPSNEIIKIITQILHGPSQGNAPSQTDEKEMAEQLRKMAREAHSLNMQPVDPIQTISFIYLSDLLDVILEGIDDFFPAAIAAIDEAEHKEDSLENAVLEKANLLRYAANFQKYRLVLGPLEITNANKEKAVVNSAFVSLGDVPISMRYLLEWLTKKMLKKDEVIYPLPKFTKDLVNELLKNFLNSDQCFRYKARQPTRLAESVLTAYTDDEDNNPKLDELTQKILAQEQHLSVLAEGAKVPRRLKMSAIAPADTPVLSVNGAREVALNNPGIDKEINYMVYYAARTQPTEKMKGDRDEDHARGVWHYQIGRDRGIVKNIQLKKTDAPGLKELRFEQEGYDGLQQLREMYDATIECYGDVSAFPGLYIYISPGGFSPGASMDLTQFGIGGYYMIIRSEHSYGPGKSDTTITAKWVAEVDATLTQNANTDPDSKECEAAGNQRANDAIDTPTSGGFLDTLTSWF